MVTLCLSSDFMNTSYRNTNQEINLPLSEAPAAVLPSDNDCQDESLPDLDSLSLLEQAKRVLLIESNAIAEIGSRLTTAFERAIELLYNCRGKVVVTGIGKSGHIAGKLAATFASTGTPAFFVHPAELRHGDFGMMDERDLIVVLSGTGETSEIKLALEPIKRLGVKIIALTGNVESTLGKVSDIAIDVGISREACPLNLAPTTSTTAALAMGDALAIVLMTKKGFSAEDFSKSHPGGSLGKQLVTVKNIMRSGVEVPATGLNASHAEVLAEVDRKKIGFTTVCNEDGQLAGMITDGDLRRALLKWNKDVFAKKAHEIMSKDPKTIAENCLASEALKIMETYSISALLIVDSSNRPVGLIDLKDLLKAGVI
jgi:arabinose-5-phosphate isomerase